MNTVETLTAALSEAHRTGERADTAPLPEPDYEEALEIQRWVQAGLGAVAGFKVARRPEGPPVIAPIRTDLTVPSGAAVAVRDEMGVELEIGFELIAEPAVDMLSEPQEYFKPRIAIELVDTRLDRADVSAMLKLADMQINAGLVLGPTLEGWDGQDFGDVAVDLRRDGQAVVEGTATVPGGSALRNLALLCDSVGDHCGGLCKGQVVITGSLTGLRYFPAQTELHGEIAGFGAVSCHLT